MISAKQFAVEHHSFWQAHAPALESVVRAVNSGGYERFQVPIEWKHSPERNYLINEVAFCLASFGLPIKKENVDIAFNEAKNRLYELPGVPNEIDDLNEKERSDTVLLATRLIDGLTHFGCLADVQFSCHFRGCGIIDGAIGDARTTDTIIEIKSGDRNFRSTDFRQLITYFFLDAAEKNSLTRKLVLLNPRLGIGYASSAEQLIFDASAKSIPSLLTDFLSATGIGGPSR